MIVWGGEVRATLRRVAGDRGGAVEQQQRRQRRQG